MTFAKIINFAPITYFMVIRPRLRTPCPVCYDPVYEAYDYSHCLVCKTVCHRLCMVEYGNHCDVVRCPMCRAERLAVFKDYFRKVWLYFKWVGSRVTKKDEEAEKAIGAQV